MSLVTFSVIIPAYNEQQFFEQLLEKLVRVPFEARGYLPEIVIVNDGSTDRTGAIARAFQATHPQMNITYIEDTNHGKGHAVKQGIAHATGDILVIQDADLEYDPSDLLEGADMLLHHQLDVMYGSRIRGFMRYGFTYSTIPFLLG